MPIGSFRSMLLCAFGFALVNGCSGPRADDVDSGGIAPAGELRLIPYRDGDSWGFVKTDGTAMVEPQYDYAWLGEDGYGRITRRFFVGLVHPDGRVLTQPEFTQIGVFSSDRAVVGLETGKYGFVDTAGVMVIDAVYDYAYDFYHGVAIVRRGDIYSLLRPDGQLIRSLPGLEPYLDPLYASGGIAEASFDPGYIPVLRSSDRLAGMLDSEGRMAVEPQYHDLSRPIGGRMIALKDQYYGLVGLDGRIWAPFDYEYMWHIGSGQYYARAGDHREGILDAEGQVVIPMVYSGYLPGPGGFHILYRGDRCGMLNAQGQEVVPFDYLSLSYQFGYLIAVRADMKTGLLDMEGRVVLPFAYEGLEALNADRYLADYEGHRGILDRRGRWILPAEYEARLVGGETESHVALTQRARAVCLLFREQVGYMYDADGHRLTDKHWLYGGYTDQHGLTWATDINGRENCFGPDGTWYGRDPEVRKLTVQSVQALYDAIGPDREITLAPGSYDLSKVSGETPYAAILEGGVDQRTVVLRDVVNLTIRAEAKGKAELVIPHAFLPVLQIERSHHVRLEGLIMGHAVQPGLCEGSVVTADGVTGLYIEHCDLYGSGSYGLEARFSNRLLLRHTTIRECTYGIMHLSGCSEVGVYDGLIRDNRGFHLVDLPDTWSVEFARTAFVQNHAQEEWGPYAFFNTRQHHPTVLLRECRFEGCSADYLASMEGSIREERTDRRGLLLRRALYEHTVPKG